MCVGVCLCVRMCMCVCVQVSLGTQRRKFESVLSPPSSPSGPPVSRALLDLCWGTGGAVYAEFVESSLVSLCELLPKGSIVVDLGSGSGRTLAELGRLLRAECVGYEECPVRFEISRCVIASLSHTLRQRTVIEKMDMMHLWTLPVRCITFAFDLVFVPRLMLHLEQLQRKHALYVCTTKPNYYSAFCWSLLGRVRMRFRCGGGTATMCVFFNTSL